MLDYKLYRCKVETEYYVWATNPAMATTQASEWLIEVSGSGRSSDKLVKSVMPVESPKDIVYNDNWDHTCVPFGPDHITSRTLGEIADDWEVDSIMPQTEINELESVIRHANYVNKDIVEKLLKQNQQLRNMLTNRKEE